MRLSGGCPVGHGAGVGVRYCAAGAGQGFRKAGRQRQRVLRREIVSNQGRDFRIDTARILFGDDGLTGNSRSVRSLSPGARSIGRRAGARLTAGLRPVQRRRRFGCDALDRHDTLVPLDANASTITGKSYDRVNVNEELRSAFRYEPGYRDVVCYPLSPSVEITALPAFHKECRRPKRCSGIHPRAKPTYSCTYGTPYCVSLPRGRSGHNANNCDILDRLPEAHSTLRNR